jgi:hypothetical protein
MYLIQFGTDAANNLELLVYVTVVFQPTTDMITFRVMMSPVNDSALGAPLILTIEFNRITLA